MTKLEQLIKELCPNGVEYKKLGEVATISRGGSFQKKDFCEDGVPCIHYGQIYTRYGLFADKTLTSISEDAAKKQKYAVKNDIVMAVTSENIDDVCKCVAWLGDDEIAVSGHTAIIHHTLNPKYLCYYFHTAMFYAQKKKLAHGTKVIEVTPDKLADITIPVPPLEVQAEIVKILDEYSTSVTALQQELEAELTARKKQYEYYRNRILNTINADTHELGDVCTFIRGPFGGSLKKECFQLQGYAVYEQQHAIYSTLDIRYYINEEKYSELKRFAVHENDLIVSCSGTIGKIFIIPPNAPLGIINQALLKLTPSKKIIPKYLKYLFENKITSDINDSARGGAIKNVPSVRELKQIKIPVPSIEEQEHIVNILDRFDKLCNDISEGLPAEIEARRKQYEYYRDKLLSFEEVKA